MSAQITRMFTERLMLLPMMLLLTWLAGKALLPRTGADKTNAGRLGQGASRACRACQKAGFAKPSLHLIYRIHPPGGFGNSLPNFFRAKAPKRCAKAAGAASTRFLFGLKHPLAFCAQNSYHI